MTRTILTLTFIFSCGLFFSQELHQKDVFQVRKVGNKYSKEFLIQSLTSADWCGLINPNESYEISFDDGAIVIVRSFNDLKGIMVFIPENCILQNDMTDNALYALNDIGHVLRFVSSKNHNPTKQTKQ